MESPEYVQTSTAAAITLKLFPGRFYRGARLKALNLLLTYSEGCRASCAYCGLSRKRVPLSGRTFIRVDWPTFATDEIIARANTYGKHLERVCISMVTHPRAYQDTLTLVRRFREETPLAISTLISPTLMKSKEMLAELKRAGAEMCGIAVDCATPELFDALRGRGMQGPHRWEHYWRVVDWAVAVFGRLNVSVHLIVGLGESEREMLAAVQRAYDAGAEAHLFAFYPEPGSVMQEHERPGIEQYRRVQLARYLIHRNLARYQDMRFSTRGEVVDFGVSRQVLEEVIEEGKAFMTSGCRGRDGEVACNRPYGNERPGEVLRNFPFLPSEEDKRLIRRHLGLA
ncbi:radical SAM protein [Candidatus Pyrohabitans sp.]